MGAGEEDMKNWGFVAAGIGLGLGLFAFVGGILSVLALKQNQSLEFENTASNYAIFVVVLAVFVVILCGVAFARIWHAHQLYLEVAARAGRGMIATTAAPAAAKPPTPPVTVTTSSRSNQPPPPATTLLNDDLL